MRLKKLKIFGFKSFADKLSLDFDSEVVGIVGPNGCGKSNIVDAFRWVMGEQSAKSMRGDKMHDVLFAGTDKRGPLNLAEVSVTLTDVGEMLPVEYDEVTITRRLHRSGESEYLLNGDPVRLKDLHALFMGSGIGKNAFSIFEQGKLDQVIHLSPVDRRSIFDESAGIGRFLQRKKEAVRKLEQVSANYERLKDIYGEVEKQSRVLKRQASQAKNYQNNRERLESLGKTILRARWNLAIDGNSERYRGIVAEVEEVQKSIADLETSLEEQKASLAEKEKEAHLIQELSYKAKGEYQLKAAEQKRHLEKMDDAEEKEKREQAELELLARRHWINLQGIKEKEGKLQEHQKEKEQLEKIVDEKRAAHESSEEEVNRFRDEQRTVQREHLVSVQEENRLSTHLQEKKLRFENNQERFFRVQDELKEKKSLLKALEKEKGERREKVSAISEVIDKFQKDQRIIECKNEKIKCQINEQEEGMKTLLHEIAELQAREKSLIRLREEFEGFSSGAKELLKESQKAKSPLHGKIQGLFESLAVKEGQEALALRNYAQTLVVKSQADLMLVIEFAKKKKWDDFSILCLEQLESATCQSHFLKELHRADTLIKAIRHVEKKPGGGATSKDGYFIDNKNVIFQANLEKSEGNTFLREAELKESAKTIRAVRAKRDRLESTLKKLTTDRDGLQLQATTLEKERRKTEMGLVEENFALQRIIADLEKERESLSQLTKEREERKGLGDGVALEIKTLEKDDQKARERRFLLHSRVQEVELRVEEQLILLKKASADRQESETTLQKMLSRWHGIRQEIRIFEVQDQEIQEQEAKLSKERKESQTLLKNGVSMAKELASTEKAQLVKAKELEVTSSRFEKEVVQEKSRKETLEKSVFEKQKLIAGLEQQRRFSEVERAEKASERHSIEADLKERYNLSIEELPSTQDNNLEEMQERVRRLRYEIEKAGAVNMTSIDEYQEQEERAQNLSKQLADLAGAKKDFEKIISKLDSESRKLFKETFAKIRKKFQKNFQILFDGGEADLKFTDSHDVLEAGIEIVAKPPGKQMRSISLLSGGEKCLTALGLLFSIFEVKPAPFCILDEVDAPLDDSNIDRFTKIVKQFVDKTQFIIVTNNKKTMSMADILFGVSMAEKGVSKLISLEFERKKEKVPA